MKTENMKINFLTQMAPQQQMQTAAGGGAPAPDAAGASADPQSTPQPAAVPDAQVTAADEATRQTQKKNNEKVLAATITDLTVTFYDYIDNAGGFFGFLAGGRKRAAKENIDGFVPIISNDLVQTLNDAYAETPPLSKEQIQYKINGKLEKLKTETGFQEYMVELANQKKADGTNVLTEAQLKSIFGDDYKKKMEDGFTSTELSDKFKGDINKLYSDEATVASVTRIVNKGKEMLMSDDEAIKAYQEDVARKAAVAKKEGEFDFMKLLEQLAKTFPGLQVILDLIKGFTGGGQDKAAQTGQGVATNTAPVLPTLTANNPQPAGHRAPEVNLETQPINYAAILAGDNFALGDNWQQHDGGVVVPGHGTAATNGVATGQSK